MYVETSTLALILFASMVFLIVGAFLGDHHVDVGGDVGHGDAGFGGDTHHGVTTSELFNFRNLALLAAGYSATSIIARNANFGELATNVSGIGGALVMVAFGVWLFRIIRRQESNSITSNTDLVGKTAFVTISIPEQGYGEITLRNALGASTSLTAKSTGRAIRTGSEVSITAVSGNIATVNMAV